MVDNLEDKNHSELQRLRKIRKNLKQRKPKFRRVESWRYNRVKENWRKARGIDSKTRRKEAGWPKSPTIGYRSPKKIRYQTNLGKEEILIYSPDDLSLIDSTNQIGRIAANIGRKKKERIITEAELLSIKIINPISVKVDLGDLEDELELDEELLEDIAIEDLELTDEEGGEEE
ncbi:MAG: 50S ribosomal protein L32e [Candidatus Hodarchaeota archaeon]